MPKTLIILFGHTNEPDLSEIAISRCDKAIDLIKDYPDAVILPTGAFGHHFNTTDRSHSSHLSDYLLGHGIEKGRVLAGTNSSNTLEDCLCARKLIIDNSYSSVIAVTSDYHCPRVLYILNYVFSDIQFSIEPAVTPSSHICFETKEEAKRFNRLKREWVNLPLYKKNMQFPQALYEVAADEQKHYDTISLAVVSGATILGWVVLQAAISANDLLPNYAMLFTGALMIFLLFVVYERCAESARTARRYMRYTELGFDAHGYSAGYNPDQLFKKLPSIQVVVRFIFSILFVIPLFLTVIITINRFPGLLTAIQRIFNC